MKTSSLRESVFNFIISAIFRKIYNNLFQVSNYYTSLQFYNTACLSYTSFSPDKPPVLYRSTYFFSPRLYLKLFAYLPLRVYTIERKRHDGKNIRPDRCVRPGRVDLAGGNILDIIPVTDIVVSGCRITRSAVMYNHIFRDHHTA